MSRNDWVTSEKGKLFYDWSKTAIKLMEDVRMTNSRIYYYKTESDELDIKDLMDDYIRMEQDRKAEKMIRLMKYKTVVMDLIKSADFSSIGSPKGESDMRRFIQMRYMRGLPIFSKTTLETIERRMNLTRHSLTKMNHKACTILGENFDPNTPPV